ncbi:MULTISPECIES: YlxR family protein [unclassified Synechococcus]|uniref:YlxR family protein n=1 Tax=unclassified Synechococcus TaxID=2626047 RepID=UPI0021A3CEF6|nr:MULTISPECIES: YlxR family protein [unclassified Synechococcus]MCT0213412.1 YlxR family protein [Synechococcus sp. CS-1326]MCT0232734.1 YlxR family protein [Synechococcus sp. CS-1327]
MNPAPTLRRCVSCRQLRDRRLLWRVIRLPGREVVLDHGMGRSAYLCPASSCLADAKRHRRLQRALRCEVVPSIYAALDQRLVEAPIAASEAR